MKLLLPLLLVACVQTDAEPPAQSFEVASIKRSTWLSPTYFEAFASAGANCNRQNVKVEGLRVTVLRASICGLIRTVYDLQRYQVLGAPKWIMEPVPEVYFDIEGLAVGGPVSPDGAKQMLRALLAERFGLQFHRETRELPVYALTVAKGGPKVSKTDTECGRPPTIKARIRGSSTCKAIETMAQLAAELTAEVDRPVIDQTGFKDKFAFSLIWSPEDAPVVPDSPPGLFPAIQEQLGLKLEPAKSNVEVLVIDVVTKPTEN